jgi:Mn-dependent DtxR family transcriptional regulator
MIHNRVNRNEFALRQEFIAEMLGVHRPTVSIAAKVLQKAGLIDYSRGQMRILDPEGLKNGACECYSLIEGQIAQLRSPEILAEEGVAD